MTNFLFDVPTGDIIYDIETFPNVFSIGLLHAETKKRWVFEISFRRNDTKIFCLFLDELKNKNCRMIGYNNLGFDYPVIHFIYKNSRAFINVNDIYNKAMSIINAPFNTRFDHLVWRSEWIVNQIDLYKIHHFDNASKATGLKMLEFNMNMDSIEDLPFDVGTVLDNAQANTLINYMWHDIEATDMFYDRTKSHILMRERLSKAYGRDMMNMSDVKIGETILVTQIEKAGIKCYKYINNKKVKRQTKRDYIDLGQVIFPYVNFESVEFQNIKNYLSSKVITETKGVFKELIASVKGIDYKFGTGGLHASINSKIIYTNETHQIVDVDVASFYPNLAIKNKLYPAHLGQEFCDAYLSVYETRKTYKKGTPENEAFKLALNGAYGGSNNEHSPFYDPYYTMSITINGQLLLCMLIEQMIKVPGLIMVQANTDGITYLCPHEHIDHTRDVCRWWEKLTNLELEESLYSMMAIRDVNNYLAKKQCGYIKRIGAYAYETANDNPGTRELPYHKDWSARVVAKAAEAALVHGKDIKEFIINHDITADFFLRTKVPRNSTLEWGDERVPNIVRYYISQNGKPLEKVMPPNGPIGEYKRANKLTDSYFDSVINQIGFGVWDDRIHTKNKSVYGARRTRIHTGWNVQLCNNIKDVVVKDVNYSWYIKEANKLVETLGKLNGVS